MNSSSRPTTVAGRRSSLSEVPPISPAHLIDFFDVRDRLLAESERTAQNSGVDKGIQQPAIRPEHSLALAAVFEQVCYWLIWVVVLTALAFGIFGL